MRVIHSIKTLQRTLRTLREQGKSVAFVPTMGYFHQGHLQLMREAKRSCDVCVVSIYVNPAQFGAREDLSRYPRNLKRDSSLARKENVDIVFAASDNEIYPSGYLTYIDVKQISGVLCGAYRPGHFQGVATIVAKLLNIVRPDVMFLGAKDAQQVVVLKKMVLDLNFPVRIIVSKTVREKDGLALSSRNVFLSVEQRKQAVCLNEALEAAKKRIKQGERRVDRLIAEMRNMITKYPLANIQYVACVNALDLSRMNKVSGKVLIALAVYFGKTRLIDNAVVKINDSKTIKD